VSVDRGYPVRQILVALVVLPALYLDFNIYRTGNVWVAIALLVVIGLGAFVYLSEIGYTYRYLFPGFLGFGLFVIFPIVYMVFLSFTKYSSQNLLYFDRALALLRQETYSVGNISYKYKLYAQDDGNYILYLENDSDPTKRFESAPFA
jgi:maltose/maltodextrin transport system permease protein